MVDDLVANNSVVHNLAKGSGTSMDPVRIEIDTPEAGKIFWEFPPSLQELYRTFPAELQDVLLKLTTEQLEAFARTMKANIISGSTAEVLIKLFNTAMLIASEQAIDILRRVSSGELPPCGDANCTLPHE